MTRWSSILVLVCGLGFPAPACRAEAEVRLPGIPSERVREGDHPLAEAAGVRAVRQENNETLCLIGSGSYDFHIAADPAAWKPTAAFPQGFTLLGKVTLEHPPVAVAGDARNEHRPPALPHLG